jgi:hypothetical protein
MSATMWQIAIDYASFGWGFMAQFPIHPYFRNRAYKTFIISLHQYNDMSVYLMSMKLPLRSTLKSVTSQVKELNKVPY